MFAHVLEVNVSIRFCSGCSEELVCAEGVNLVGGKGEPTVTLVPRSLGGSCLLCRRRAPVGGWMETLLLD